MSSRIACALALGRSLPNAIERVKRAEEMGYESVFVGQTAGRDALTIITAYACATEKIRVGTSIAPIYARVPAAMAQAAVTIDEMSAGRLDLGLGVSHKAAVTRWYGQDMDSPLRDMREYFTTVRSIVSGQDYSPGDRWRTQFQLDGIAPRPKLRMYMAALSPGMLRLAGELADGVVLYLCSPDYIRRVVVPELDTGLARSGRTLADFEVIPVVSAALTTDRAGAEEHVRRDLAPYLQLPFYRSMIARSGFADVIDEFDTRADAAGERAPVPDAYIELIAAIGGSSDIAACLSRYRAAGATMPVISPLGGYDTLATLEAVARV